MKRIILAISVLLVLGLAAAAIAYNRASNVEAAAASCCCCSGDSCPMKKDGAAKDTGPCCGDDCCQKGESCPMKNSDAKMAEHPDNCPMKNQAAHAEHATMTEAEHQAMQADGKACCCSCCGSKSDA